MKARLPCHSFQHRELLPFSSAASHGGPFWLLTHVKLCYLYASRLPWLASAFLNEHVYFPYKQSNDTSTYVTSTRRSTGTTTKLLPFPMRIPPGSSLSLFFHSPLIYHVLSKPGAPSCRSDLQSNHILLYTVYNQIILELQKIKGKGLQGTGYHLPTLRRGSEDRISKLEWKTFSIWYHGN